MKKVLSSNAKVLGIDYQEELEDIIAKDMYNKRPSGGFASLNDLQSWYEDAVAFETVMSGILNDYNSETDRTQKQIFEEPLDTLAAMNHIDAFIITLHDREVSANQVRDNLNVIQGAIQDAVLPNNDDFSSIDDFLDSYTVDSEVSSTEGFLENIYNEIYDKGTSMLTMKSGLDNEGRCGQSCGEVDNQDYVSLIFNKKMDAGQMGTDYNVVLEPNGLVNVYIGDQQEADQRVATILPTTNMNDNNGEAVTFADSTGAWSRDDHKLLITMKGKDGTTKSDNSKWMRLDWTSLTIGQAAVDKDNNHANPITTVGLPSRW